ncbi:hypothetical protein GCM10010435_91750 [Winogradskya consettensis]|uniref:GP-PDE domain-containing protein n=1 Tax=Winogradskya consettensis TaxID=113560 RepID=A0A919W0C1_9ACTN|nr:hypothetical protein Aco04nite_76410 [Actinoplanes consettensis]
MHARYLALALAVLAATTAAHRGYWRGAPENSLPAITQAIQHGAHIVEIDVQRTSDGELVLMHDDSVDRTTDGTGKVVALTLAQMRSLRLRSGLGGAHGLPELNVDYLEFTRL